MMNNSFTRQAMAEIITLFIMIITTFSQMFKCASKPHLIITSKNKKIKMQSWNVLREFQNLLNLKSNNKSGARPD